MRISEKFTGGAQKVQVDWASENSMVVCTGHEVKYCGYYREADVEQGGGANVSSLSSALAAGSARGPVRLGEARRGDRTVPDRRAASSAVLGSITKAIILCSGHSSSSQQAMCEAAQVQTAILLISI